MNRFYGYSIKSRTTGIEVGRYEYGWLLNLGMPAEDSLKSLRELARTYHLVPLDTEVSHDPHRVIAQTDTILRHYDVYTRAW